MKRRYEVPPAFWYDSHDLQGGVGRLVGKRGHRLIIEATDDEIAELRSRAKYYTDPGTVAMLEPHLRGLSRSAAATLKALDDQATN